MKGDRKTGLGHRPQGSTYRQVAREFAASIVGLTYSQAFAECQRHQSRELRIAMAHDAGGRPICMVGFIGFAGSWVRMQICDGKIVGESVAGGEK